MRPVETIGHLEVRNLAAIVVCCCLAVFIGVMLTKQYISHGDMARDRILAIKQNLEKRSSAVHYFFSERYGDLKHLRTDQALNGYFENLSMGMSMKYGLKSSLFCAARQFFFTLESEVIGQEPIYSRILFITREGKILIDTLGAPDTFPGFCSHLRDPGEKPREILSNGENIAVSLPFYFKEKYAGQLVAFMRAEIIDRHLVRQSGCSAGFYALTSGDRAPHLPAKVPLRLSGTDGIDPGLFEDGEVRILEGEWGDKARARVIAMGTRIPETPFSIIALSLAESMSGKNIFAIMGAFVLFIGTGIFFIWRTATQKLIFGVRLQASKQTEAHFRDLVEFLPIPIGEYGLDLKLRYANKEALAFFGYTRADIDAGMSLTEIIQEHELPKTMERLAKLRQGENPGPTEISVRRRDGKEIWGKAIPGLIYENRACVGVRTCFIDYTQRRKSEQESILAAEQEKFALVGQVAGKMAHDFNNILSAIMGNTELTLMDCRDNDIRATLEIILEQAKRGNILTRNLVAFAKDQEIKEEYFNINRKMDLVLSLLKKELEGITLIKNYQKALPELLADPGMMEHALVNLVQNAIHAMGKSDHPVLGLETRADEHQLTIAIQDNGCGIPENHAKDIYSPSFSLKGSRDLTKSYRFGVRGTGYGLSNVKKYIDKHKGSIEFVSKEGRGTRFTITLPIVAKALLPDEKEEMLKKPLMRNRRILMVEDEPAISMVLEKILTGDPFFHTVRLAGDGASAMEMADCEPFDLISLDYMLPGRINGLDVYTHIRKTNKKLPVIFISGNIRFLESMRTLKASDPYMDHLPKPFANLTYADKINDWLQPD
ncbi:MAG: ATP-binding protein [Desulfobacterales bacterium]|nr:ATP-binding protein [Desulfobacterales bacterium]